MSALDPRIQIVADKYGLKDSDFWELAQRKGTWIAKHSALEVAAVKAGIRFDMPVVVEQKAGELITSIIVQGTMGERTEWSIGETNPSNYHVSGKQPSYPWAMSEKRAKDRVILKLIGISGLVYSEDEADDFRPDRQIDEPAPKPASKLAMRPIDGEMRKEIEACMTVEELERLWRSTPFKVEYQKLPKDWQEALIEFMGETKANLIASPPRDGYVAPNFDAAK